MTKTMTMRLAKAMVLTACLAVAVALALAAMDEPAEAQQAETIRPEFFFKLGKTNAVNALSSMVGSLAEPILRLDNNGSGPALDLQVEPGNAPLSVNPEAGKAANLDADKIDGLDSSDFLRADSSDLLLVEVQGNSPSSTDVATVSRLRTGVFLLEFEREVDRCSRLVSRGAPRGNFLNADLTEPGGGEVTAELAVTGEFDDTDRKLIVVATRDSAGNLADLSFHLAVFC